MLKHVLTSLVLLSLCAGAALAKKCQSIPLEWQHWVAQGEPYSVSACDGMDPKNAFEEMKAQMENSPYEVIRLNILAGLAKAALEAGLNEQAETYAEQALATAGQERFRNARPVSFEEDARANAIFLANLVLGRLALLNGYVELAETYLLRSSQIEKGQASIWGPNMTLARELLKLHRSETVLLFLKECGEASPRLEVKLDRWTETIRKGKIPNFGANLVYF